MTERRGAVTLNGRPMTLVGEEIKVGQKAVNCTFIDKDLKQDSLANYFGNTLVVMSVPSLDTPVCSLEAQRFNQELAKLKDQNIKAILISMDLPFAQKRWCSSEKDVVLSLFSDYKFHEFGNRYGVYVNELGLLARAIFIIDPSGIVRYIQIVNEISQEPKYEEVLDQIKSVIKL
jgi:thiol peroxidase